jgi:hypothetical protein
MIKKKNKKVEQIRIDFSLRGDVFFIVVDAIVGAVTHLLFPKLYLKLGWVCHTIFHG